MRGQRIGVSNHRKEHLAAIMETATVTPTINQCQLAQKDDFTQYTLVVELFHKLLPHCDGGFSQMFVGNHDDDAIAWRSIQYHL